MTTQTFAVTGLTCGHCAGAVTEEPSAIEGVDGVSVDLVAGGASTVSVRADRPLNESAVATARDEAGDYRLAPR